MFDGIVRRSDDPVSLQPTGNPNVYLCPHYKFGRCASDGECVPTDPRVESVQSSATKSRLGTVEIVIPLRDGTRKLEKVDLDKIDWT